MNRFVLLGVLVFAILGMTFIANAANNLDPSYTPPADSIEDGVPAEVDNTIGSVKSIINTWIKMMTFSMEGFPNWVTGLLFLPLNFIVMYMIIDIIKDIIPFT